MNRYIYKTVVYLSMFGLGVFHLSPYYITYPIVLYYVCLYSLVIMLILNASYPLKVNKYDKYENVVLIAYMASKMTYHIAHLNTSYHAYLCSLRSELWAGVFTFMVLGIMFSFQCINLVRYVKKR